MRLAKRAQAMAPSSTMAMDALAKDMRRAGVDVVGFGVGEPDFDTPENIKEAAVAAIRQGFTKYTPPAGTLELKAAIRAKFERDNGLAYGPAEIIVTVGAKHALYNALQVLCDPGDEVILAAPYWVSYVDQVRLAGGVPVVIPTDEGTGFKLTPQALRPHLRARTRAVILNSPANPTGAVYEQEELAALAEVVLGVPDCLIISDEIYEPLIYDGRRHVSVAALDPAVKARTLVVNGVSKTYAMTGWRIGYAAGPEPLIQAMGNLQSHSTSNPTSVAQVAAVEALQGPQEAVARMVEAFARRRDYMLERLRGLAGVRCLAAGGAFYLFPRIDAAFGRRYRGQLIADSDTLAHLLLKEARVAVVPGSAFGAQPYVRLSYAASCETIARGMDRIEDFWRQLS